MLRMTSDDAALAVHSSSQMASLRMPSSSWASSVKVAVMDLMRISDTLCRLCSLPSWPMPTPNAETLRKVKLYTFCRNIPAGHDYVDLA